MRPLRLLLSLATGLTAISLLLYLVFGDQYDEEEQQLRGASAPDQRSRLNALFSFTSPGSLFPPSAIISLTDDNSTFFLARPAAFGPSLPPIGLSGALWIGSGFGDETMGRGELGCSDVPGWDDGSGNGDVPSVDASSASSSGKVQVGGRLQHSGKSPKPEQRRDTNDADSRAARHDDGTDDHLHHSQPASGIRHASSPKSSARADIQSLQEGAEIAGKVVLLKRGGCGFLEKVLWAQRRGGVALIVGDDVRGGGLVRMYARGDTSNVTIPALFTSHTTAHLLSTLLPTGGIFQNLSSEDVAKLKLIKGGKGVKTKSAERPDKKQEKGIRPTATQNRSNPTHTGKTTTEDLRNTERLRSTQEMSWLDSLLSAIGFGGTARTIAQDDSRRPPGSGKLDWVLVEKEGEVQQPARTQTTGKTTSIPSPSDFVIGEQDWRDTGLLPQPTSTNIPQVQRPGPETKSRGDNARPSSGEYIEKDIPEKSNRWFSGLTDGKRDSPSDVGTYYDGSGAKRSTDAHSEHDVDSPDIPEPHEGLWVTLTPTNMSSSPFFDTLLVLVVSPLVTLTVVYALLLLRSRIRRRRWRAPKSLVERLPIRTYHTISDSSPSATPNASSPSTPLLQHSPPRPASPLSRPRSRTESEVPATSSSFLQPNRTPEEEKRESGLAAWRRRYGGRQKECVVCLDEYEDGVSQVMSLPCGHEFHADCM